MGDSPPYPVLFLDVDGPLLPFGAPPEAYPAHRHTGPRHAAARANPLLARLDPALGPKLAALPCELVWATTWADEANECLSPLLGLPELPVLEWPEEPAAQQEADRRSGLHWKTRPLVAWAAGRPFAWVDDEIGAADRIWVAAHHRGAVLLHGVDARTGLTDADFTVIGGWLRESGGAQAVRVVPGR